jgi:hypothetical protein
MGLCIEDKWLHPLGKERRSTPSARIPSSPLRSTGWNAAIPERLLRGETAHFRGAITGTQADAPWMIAPMLLNNGE